MFVPIILLILTLLVAVAIGLYAAKRRVVDNEQKPDIRPDDPRPGELGDRGRHLNV